MGQGSAASLFNVIVCGVMIIVTIVLGFTQTPLAFIATAVGIGIEITFVRKLLSQRGS